MPELHAIAGGRGNIGARLKANPGLPMPLPGDPTFALVVLVLLELGALIWLRRAFKESHGG